MQFRMVHEAYQFMTKLLKKPDERFVTTRPSQPSSSELPKTTTIQFKTIFRKISTTDISIIHLTTLITINFPVLRPWKKTLTQTTFGWERRETEEDQGGLKSDDLIITF